MAFAGLWERWQAPKGIELKGSLANRRPGDIIETCTVLTAAGNEVVAPIHDCIPVILAPELFDPWLTGESAPLGPCPPLSMARHPARILVNKPSNDHPRCIEPIADR